MVTMLNAEAEIQYVALSSIEDIMNQFPSIFHETYKVRFVFEATSMHCITCSRLFFASMTIQHTLSTKSLIFWSKSRMKGMSLIS